jgi:amidase
MKDLGRRVAGWPCSMGSRFAGTGPAADDSVLIERYRAAGLIFLGTTNTPEFGIPGVTHSSRLGLCKNPWNLAHTPGGSSGGSAAAVAAGMARGPRQRRSGLDRIPAACCGVVGLKPTRDAIRGRRRARPRLRLVVDLSYAAPCATARRYLATSTPQAASPYAAPAKARVVDSCAALGRVASRGRRRPRTAGLRSGCGTGHRGGVDLLIGLPRRKAARCSSTGWRLPIRAHDAGRQLRRRDAGDRRAGRPRARRRRARPAGAPPPGRQEISGADALAAMRRVRALSWQLLEQFSDIDVLVTPVLGSVPPLTADLDPVDGDLRTFDRRTADSFPFTPPFNMTGQPAISLPLVHSAGGLPIGMMFTARYGDEATLFRLAAQLESARRGGSPSAAVGLT